MTDKRKKAARELAAKTGMSYHAALNARMQKPASRSAAPCDDNDAQPSSRATFFVKAAQEWRELGKSPA